MLTPPATDRELHHINPKGRPVKQCEHCRGARKSKSHHAKCDCGDKKDKHKDKGDAKGMLRAGSDSDEASNDDTAHDNRCNCHSGAKCICGIKKEPIDLRLDLRLDTSRQTLHDARAKPKLTSTHSESTLTVFANGHHKPCHRNNNTAHVSGMPYKIPRPHTLHGHADFAALGQGNGYGQGGAAAARSMDTLSLSNTDFYAMFGSGTNAAENGLPPTPVTGSLDVNGTQDSLFTSQNSAFGQGGHSPTESQLSESMAASQWPWASSLTSTNRNFGLGSLSTSPSQDCLPNLDTEWAIPSAGLTNPTWSATDLPLNPSKLADSFVQPISQSGESKQSAPGLTASSSSPSEMGDPALFGDVDFRAPQSTTSESLFWEDSPVYRLATSAAIENRTPTSAPQSSTPDSQALELDFSKAMSATSISAASSGLTNYSETQAIAMPNNIDDVASNDPWLYENNTAAFAGFAPYDFSFLQ